jgi:hypothetical protein
VVEKGDAEGFLEVDTADKILVGAYSWVVNALIGQTVFIVYVCRIRIFIDMLAFPDHFASQEGGLGDFRRLVVFLFCKDEGVLISLIGKLGPAGAARHWSLEHYVEIVNQPTNCPGGALCGCN